MTDAPYTEPTALDGTDHDALVALVASTSARGTAALRELWDDLVIQLGADAASRLWLEALAQSDASQET